MRIITLVRKIIQCNYLYILQPLMPPSRPSHAPHAPFTPLMSLMPPSRPSYPSCPSCPPHVLPASPTGVFLSPIGIGLRSLNLLALLGRMRALWHSLATFLIRTHVCMGWGYILAIITHVSSIYKPIRNYHSYIIT